jgi:signal transduction histidine kinase
MRCVFASVFGDATTDAANAFSDATPAAHVFDGWIHQPPIVHFALFVCSSVLLFLSVRLSKSGKTRGWRLKVDFSLIAALAVCIILVCANYTRQYTLDFARVYSPRFYVIKTYPIQPLPLFSLAYAALATMLLELAARLRDKTLASTLCWLSFFRLYPLRNPKGLIAAIALTASVLYLTVFCLVEAIYFVRLRVEMPVNVPAVVLATLVVVMMTLFCRLALSLSAEYDKANAEKIRAERFKAELITNVSHDIRTPLTSIINYVDLLKAMPVEREDYREYVDVLERKSARLKVLISDLMDATKAATGNLAVNMQGVDLSEIVGQIAGEFDDQFAGCDLSFVLRQPDEPVFVDADRNHLWRVLENLFGNAAKYSLPGTRVFAEIALRDGKTSLTLKNTSKTPIDLPTENLTEQFMRGDYSRQTEGSGLGLHIAKSLVELMGGSLEICVSGDLFEAEVVFPHIVHISPI